MRLKIETFISASTWDTRYLLEDELLGFTKAIMTDQGLDRVGDGQWIGGVHVGNGSKTFLESDTGLLNQITYKDTTYDDKSSTELNDGVIQWIREITYRFNRLELSSGVSEVSLSWDVDNKTATALLALPETLEWDENKELIVKVKVVVSERLDDIKTGTVDFGASVHEYTIKPCFSSKYPNHYIGLPLSQKDGRVYSGSIPEDVTQEPTGSIDSNLAVFEQYLFETRSKKFNNFFNLSSPNADTRTATSHTFGLPSAFGIEFTPPIDKKFNRELTLNFKLSWDRG